MSDVYGDHAISCGYGGESSARHSHLRDGVFQTALQAQLGPKKEAGGLFPDTDERPVDVLIPILTQGKGTLIDVTVENPLQSGMVVARVGAGGQRQAWPPARQGRRQG